MPLEFNMVTDMSKSHNAIICLSKADVCKPVESFLQICYLQTPTKNVCTITSATSHFFFKLYSI